jgi:hypothetical protein
MERGVLAQRRWGAESSKRFIAAFFAAWRLGGFAFPCPFTAQGSGSKAAKPQSRKEEERLRVNRKIP